MIHIIPENTKESFFEAATLYIVDQRNWKEVSLTRDWARSFPSKPGVYCFFENDRLKYVGETGNISARMADMLNTKNHNLRRLIGEAIFSNEIGYEMANSRKGYTLGIEMKLNQWIKENLKVCALPIHIGRKEFEDWIQDKYVETQFYNKKKKRK